MTFVVLLTWGLKCHMAAETGKVMGSFSAVLGVTAQTVSTGMVRCRTKFQVCSFTISRRCVQVLGTPTREDIHAMNPNYTEFKFPHIKAHPWSKVFSKRLPPDAVDLVSLPAHAVLCYAFMPCRQCKGDPTVSRNLSVGLAKLPSFQHCRRQLCRPSC